MEDSDKEEVKRRFEMGEMEAGERFVRKLVLGVLSRSGTNYNRKGGPVWFGF